MRCHCRPVPLLLSPLVSPVFAARCRFLFLFSTRGVFHSLCRAVGVRLSGRPRGVWPHFRGFSPGVGCCGVDIFGLAGAGLAACARRGVN